MKNIINLFIAVDYQYHCLFQGLWQTASWAVYEWRALLLTEQYMCGYYIIFQRGHGILWDIEIGIIFHLVIFSLLENNMSYFLVRKKNPHLWFQGHCSCSAHINIRQNRRHLSSVSVCSSWFMKLWHTRGHCIAWWFQSCAVPSGFWILCSPYPISAWAPSRCSWRSHDNQSLLLLYHVYSETQWRVSSSLPATRYRLPGPDEWVPEAVWICGTRVFSHAWRFLSVSLEE